MKTALVGCTGFVGGNLAAQHPFEGLYHSSDVEKAFGTQPELLVYAGLPAAKYLANSDPAGDLAVCENAFANMRRIAPQRLVLISTVDVYASPLAVDETVPADLENPAAYGRNRAKLEQLVRGAYPEALIVRLPGLFGRGLKKNFLYDFFTVTPAMLKAEKYAQLAAESELVRAAYEDAHNGFYKLRQNTPALRAWFGAQSFNALSFTDSRSVYQFYDLSHLWGDIARALAQNITLLNLAAEPVGAAECYAVLTHGKMFCNELSAPPARYDMRSVHAAQWSGHSGYLYTKEEVLADIGTFAAAMHRTEA